MTYRGLFTGRGWCAERAGTYAARNCVRSNAASILFCSSSRSDRIVWARGNLAASCISIVTPRLLRAEAYDITVSWAVLR
jgi:hypothetical protein